MKKFRDYFFSLTQESREALADECNVSWMYLRNVAYGTRSAGAKLATAIERATGGAISRKDWFPDDWHLIWPELKKGES